jgi:hypothetical protein
MLSGLQRRRIRRVRAKEAATAVAMNRVGENFSAGFFLEWPR